MKQISVSRFLLLIAILIAFIHYCLFTINNALNPITLIALIIRDDSFQTMLFIGYTLQTGVSIILSRHLLKCEFSILWLISYLFGIVLLHCSCRYLNPIIMDWIEHVQISNCYASFYGYKSAFIEFVYYLILQLFVFFTYLFLNRMRHLLCFLFLAHLSLYSCTSDYYRNLGKGYVYRDEGGDMKEIYHKFSDAEIPPTILSYSYNDKYVIAKQYPKLPRDAYSKDYNYTNDSIFYWLIEKDNNTIYGPLNNKQIRSLAEELSISDIVIIDFLQ